jgi:hypothetical protein
MRRQTEGEGKRNGARVSNGHKDTSVRDFLERLARALTAGDGRAAAALWEIPALVVGDTMTKVVSSREEMEAFFGGAKQQYNTRGVSDTRPDIVRLRWVTDRMAIVEVRWPYLDERGNEVGEEASTYTIRRDDAGDLKLVAAVMHGEAKGG